MNSSEPGQAAPRASPRNREGKISILVVDDDIDHLELVRTALEGNPLWSIDTAETTEVGFEKIKSGDYRVVLVDYRLPDGNGLDLIDWIKDDSLAIVMTSQGGEEIAVKAMKMGAYDYVVKDAVFFELLPDIVQKAIERHGADLELRQLREILKEENTKLVEANKKLRALDNIKSELLSTASHEWSQPLTIIREFVSQIRDGLAGPTTDDQKECLESALENCSVLDKLLNNVLESATDSIR